MESNTAVQELIDELEQLAESPLPPAAFYAELAGRVTAILNAQSAFVWSQNGSQEIEIVARSGPHPLDRSGAEPRHQHQRLLHAAFAAGGPRLVPPRTELGDNVANPTDSLLLLAPAGDNAASPCVVEAVRAPDNRPEAQAAYTNALSVISHLVTTYQRNQELARYREHKNWSAKFDAFARAIHLSLRLDDTASAIVNEGRLLTGCDRLSIFVRKGRKFRVAAISGQDVVQRRSNVVRLMERLASRLGALREAMHYPPDHEVAPQVADVVDRYVDEAGVTTFQFLPLRQTPQQTGDDDQDDDPSEREVVGGLLAERFAGSMTDIQGPLNTVAEHASLALGNAVRYQGIFLLPLWTTLGKIRMSRAVMFTTLIVAVIVALIVTPAEFNLAAKGTLEPVVRRHVFSPNDGVVSQLNVRHGQVVAQGEPLLSLHSIDLNVQVEQVVGDLQTTEKRLLAIQSMMLVGDFTDRAHRSRISAEREELEKRRESLQRQLALLNQQAARLVVNSPVTGTVITWNVEETLQARPVQRGQRLLTVAEVNADWHLELYLPDRRYSHLLAARKDSDQPLPVTFALATDPGSSFSGRIADVAHSTTVSEEHGHSLLITVDFDKRSLDVLQPGAVVSGKIYCGERPLWYVLFHDVTEFVEANVLFHLRGRNAGRGESL